MDVQFSLFKTLVGDYIYESEFPWVFFKLMVAFCSWISRCIFRTRDSCFLLMCFYEITFRDAWMAGTGRKLVFMSVHRTFL